MYSIQKNLKCKYDGPRKTAVLNYYDYEYDSEGLFVNE